MTESAFNILPMLAQVSVTLAGFSALLVLIRHGEAAWLPSELVALYVMVGSSLAAFLFSLLPLPLMHLGVAEPLVWSLSSLLLATFILVARWAVTRIARRRRARQRLPMAGSVILPFSYAIAAALVMSAFGPIILRDGVFLFGVVFLLTLAVIPLALFFSVMATNGGR